MTDTTTKEKVKVDPINNTALVEEFRNEGGRIVHVRETPHNRGVTFAYRVRGRRIEIATALTHSVDTFTKKVGTKTAIEHFRAGKTIFLPFGKDATVAASLTYFVRAMSYNTGA